MANDDAHLPGVLKQLKTGVSLMKQKITGKTFSRDFYLHEREGYLSYRRSHKMFGKPRVYQIKDIDEVRTGFHGQTFNQLVTRGNLKRADEDRAFSILLDNHKQEVHLLAVNNQARELWVKGLQHLVNKTLNANQGRLLQDDSWILNHFYEADKNHSNTLTKRECRDLLAKSFQIQLPDETFNRLFKLADKSNGGDLDPQEFVQFFHLLTRRQDLFEIMKSHMKDGQNQTMDEICMNRDELFHFVRIVQNMRNIRKPEEVQLLINEYESSAELRQKGLLGLDGFRTMLLSRDFDIVKTLYATHIYQDMTRPLCDYYINTSHNTYLFHSQLSGKSNPEAYNRVLLTGGRAVELDCYDGDDGPIVYHAHTLVKPCTFESIIRAIEPNLFTKSPYPVILNIENHCSLEQQKQMARILKSILGDKIVTDSTNTKDSRTLPSPEDLKYKVLIRSKKVSTSTKPAARLTKYDDDDSILDPLSKTVDSELAELFVYLQNVPYKEYEHAKANYSGFHSSSLEEDHFIKASKADPVGLIQQTTWRILRVYPGGLRQDSSNADPVQAWRFGIQMVALNYQNQDDMMPLCYGKFLDNGGCGYTLKPDYLLNAQDTEFNPWNSQMKVDTHIVLTLTIISAQFLSRSSETTSDIPDPYVSIAIRGILCDEQKGETKVVDNNGFNPTWNETFQFHIKFPQMCLVYLSVMDHDNTSRDDRICYFCLPMTMMQTGYRHIQLRANNHDPVVSTLFVHVSIGHEHDDNLIETRL